MIVGSGTFKYRVNADWAKLPEGWSFKEVGGVGVDIHDNVYLFNRNELQLLLLAHPETAAHPERPPPTKT